MYNSDIAERIRSPTCPGSNLHSWAETPTAKPKRLTDSRAEYLIKASQGRAL